MISRCSYQTVYNLKNEEIDDSAVEIYSDQPFNIYYNGDVMISILSIININNSKDLYIKHENGIVSMLSASDIVGEICVDIDKAIFSIRHGSFVRWEYPYFIEDCSKDDSTLSMVNYVCGNLDSELDIEVREDDFNVLFS